MRSIVLLAIILLTTGCASKPAITLAEVDDVTLDRVLGSDDAYDGDRVRWGGMVDQVENKADHTLVFVVARELNDDAKPQPDSNSEGRFVARFTGFIDPQVYREGRPLTVVGSLQGSVVRPIGEYDYRFPLVMVRDSHLWADPDKTKVYYHPYPSP